MKEENELIIECLNTFGRVPDTGELLKMIKELHHHWNSLREYIQEEIITSKNIGDHHWFYYQIVLDKMNELESGDK